jgi:hypothetical protein
MEEARTHYEAALANAREVGNRRFEGIVLATWRIIPEITTEGAERSAPSERLSLSGLDR